MICFEILCLSTHEMIMRSQVMPFFQFIIHDQNISHDIQNTLLLSLIDVYSQVMLFFQFIIHDQNVL